MYSMAETCSKRVLTLNLALLTLFPQENFVQSVFSVCILRPSKPVTIKKPLLHENFMEMSEIH